jgi:hypothetical protein
MISINNQQAFDNALFGIRNQGYKQSIASGKTSCASCAYRGEDGLKCGVGHSIPDELYKPEMEGKTSSGLILNYMLISELFEKVNEHLLTEIQVCHDHDLLGETSQRFEIRMKQIAKEYGVNYTESSKEIA